MSKLFDLFVEGDFIIEKMFRQVRQIIKSGVVDIEHGIEFAAYVFIDALIDETDEHVPLQLTVPILKDDEGMALRFSKD